MGSAPTNRKSGNSFNANLESRNQWSLKRITIALAAINTLSAIFIPLYGTVLGTLWGTRKAPSGQTQWPAFAIWVTGIVVFNLIARLAPEWGATIPTLLLTIALARLRA